ncbi:MAG: ATP-dependent Clp protease proteolytic subunit [Parcubacteria group bacterium]|nr:ATP-dependent Clp protease proteolytic subunit [Parcubacteria group bacterium]
MRKKNRRLCEGDLDEDEATSDGDFQSLDDDEEFKHVLLKKRIVLLTGEITEKKTGGIKGDLIELSLDSPDKDIFLIINNDGGSVNAGMSFYDFLTIFLKAPVVGIVERKCLSMALIVLQGCTKRVAAPHSFFLIHPSEKDITVVYHPSMKNRIRKIEKYLAEDEQYGNRILEKHSKLSLSEIEKLSFANDGNGTIFSAEEALEKGFIDEIAEGDKYKIF